METGRQMHIDVSSRFSDMDIEVRRRSDAPDLWTSVLEAADFAPVSHQSFVTDYHLATLEDANSRQEDCSVVIFHDRKPVGIWPLIAHHARGEFRVGADGSVILPPLFVGGLSRRTVEAIAAKCLTLIMGLAGEANCGKVSRLNFAEPFDAGWGLPAWHFALMEAGAIPALMHELYVDLRMEMGAIKSAFRKSYRSLVTSGSRKWAVSILSSVDAETWQQFRALHIRISGRQTRSEGSWNVFFDALNRGSMFLVLLRDDDARLVGAGLFGVSRDEAVYASAAYDRSLFQHPLGHVVQFHAIQEMKRRGLKWYKIGVRPYPQDTPQPTEKELAIAEFKEGFATHVFPRVALTVTR
jgi:FemAB family protein